MAYQLKERPHKFVFSNNPVRYLVEISNPGTPGSALEVELYGCDFDFTPTIDAPGTLINAQTLYPNPDGKVWFYCEDYLNSYVEWQLPDIFAGPDPGNIIAVDKQIKKFYIRYRQITNRNQSPLWASDLANIRIVIKGGVAKEKFDRNNFFINYLVDNKSFLTWQPAGHFIGKKEFRYLTYFHHYDTTPELKMKARVVFLDGTEETVVKDFPALTESLLFHLPASVSHISDVLIDNRDIWYYDISVVDADDNVYAAVYRMYVDYRNYYHAFEFIYHNSLGGMNTMRVRGEWSEEMQRNYTDVQQAVVYGDDAKMLPTENAVVNISKFEIYKGDAGWFNTKDMQDSIKDMLLSDSIYRILHNRWLRVVQLQKSQPMGESDDTKWSFPLQWRYTFDNTNFTPFNKDLGFGADDEPDGALFGVCTTPGNLVAGFIGEDGGGIAIGFTWDAVPDSENYELQYKEDGDVDWTTVISADNEEDITFMESGNYSWRVRTKCGDDDYSAYAPGPGFSINILPAACSAPAALNVELQWLDASGVANVKFSWPAVPGVVGYVFEYREVTRPTWLSINTAFLSNFQDLFDSNIEYECRIRSKCNNTPEYSGYKYGPTFIPSNMIGSCAIPSFLVVTLNPLIILDHRGANFTWAPDAGHADYRLEYKFHDATSWTVLDHVNSGVGVWFHIDRTIDWRVRANCNFGGISSYSDMGTFNT